MRQLRAEIQPSVAFLTRWRWDCLALPPVSNAWPLYSSTIYHTQIKFGFIFEVLYYVVAWSNTWASRAHVCAGS